MRFGVKVFDGLAVLLVALFVLSPTQSGASGVQKAGPGDVEVGVVLGEPTGLSFKLWTGLSYALDGGVAWSFGKGGHVHLHADYLVHNFRFFEVASGDLPIYFGIGGRVRLEEKESRVGMRIPIGVEYIFEDSPVGIFMEVVPIMDILPETAADLNAGFGVRFIF